MNMLDLINGLEDAALQAERAIPGTLVPDFRGRKMPGPRTDGARRAAEAARMAARIFRALQVRPDTRVEDLPGLMIPRWRGK